MVAMRAFQVLPFYRFAKVSGENNIKFVSRRTTSCILTLMMADVTAVPFKHRIGSSRKFKMLWVQ